VGLAVVRVLVIFAVWISGKFGLWSAMFEFGSWLMTRVGVWALVCERMAILIRKVNF
jgi:hypothetical protein